MAIPLLGSSDPLDVKFLMVQVVRWLGCGASIVIRRL
jgi:hypothetical protein